MSVSKNYTCNRYVQRVTEEYPTVQYRKALDRLSRLPDSDPRIDTDRIYQKLIFNREAVERAMNRTLWYPQGTKIYDLLQLNVWSRSFGTVSAALELNMLPQDAERLMRTFRVILYDELGLILP